MPNDTLIDIDNLKVHFPVYSKGLFRRMVGSVRAVDGVSCQLKKGQTLGLVGESGSGKTTIGRAILRALSPTAGRITFNRNGEVIDLTSLAGKPLKQFRRYMQLIFQDPYASLNPRMTVRDIIAEPLACQGDMGRDAIDAQIHDIAALCKLNIEHLRRFPHAFSGGQRQRICIARALISRPEFVVCDESVSALDVSIQAEVINLLMDLQAELGLTYLFIAHDLSVVAQIASAVAVLYVGQFVELAPTEKLFFSPRHPYTRALMSAVPSVDRRLSFDPIKLEGEIPNPADPPPGCRFHTRCPYATEICRTDPPEWRAIELEHMVACHHVETINAGHLAA
ncbi:MAG: ATP-binding cassette domain-containing protein [Desulfosarcina sp.]|jgi:oligopeptide/dipeptide ABC transporter ATP-binding protein